MPILRLSVHADILTLGPPALVRGDEAGVDLWIPSMQQIIDSLKVTAGKLTVFTGRSTRTEYWTWVLSLFVPLFVLAMFITMIDVMLDTSFSSLLGFVGIAAFALSLSVGWRRMQDSGKPGWLILAGFVPCIGAIAVIVLCCLPSQPGTNAYGPNPHGA